MKIFERLSSRMAKSASTAVKEEVKSTAIDILPTLIGIGGMIIGSMIYRDHKETVKHRTRPILPDCSAISIVTNNYYFGKEFLNHGQRDDEK